MPYRAMTNIVNFIQAMMRCAGFAATGDAAVFTGAKFYSNCIKMDNRFNTNISNFYALGDSSGWTRYDTSMMGVCAGKATDEELEAGRV